MAGDAASYWEAVSTAWQADHPQALWRAHSDAVNLGWLARSLPAGDLGRVLKTDLFDEAFGDGLYPYLAGRAQAVTGIDLSAGTVAAACRRHTGLQGVQADVRRLPFAGGAFDVVISDSTLDHFESGAEIGAALREIRRVLRPGGILLLTLDNAANPAIALRNALPYRLLHRLGILPYYVGATCGPRRLRAMLQAAGLQVHTVEAILHCPRVLAVPAAGLLHRHGSPRAQRRLLRLLRTWEGLGRCPTRFLTGHFVAAQAYAR